MIASWPCPTPDGAATGEYALGFLRDRPVRVLLVPALFDEANRLRRLLVRTMRLLDDAGIDSVLPDLPGTNESLQPLDAMALPQWHLAMISAARHFGATHILAVRGGVLVAPPALPGWSYAPTTGAAILRQMVRMRVLAAREAGREENSATLLEQGAANGLDLAGYPLSAAMVSGLQAAAPADNLTAIQQSDVGGSGLWLRAEPDDDADQAEALASIVMLGIADGLEQGAPA